MNNKKEFTALTVEVFAFLNQDVITTSGGSIILDDDELNLPDILP